MSRIAHVESVQTSPIRKLMAAGVMAASMASAAAPAHATGSFECSIDDRSLKFTAASAFSQGLGEGFVGFKAEAQILLPNAPDDLRQIDLSKNLVHHWLADGELRLRLYHERMDDKPHAYVEIILKTAGEPDDVEFAGTYKLIVFSMDPPADRESGKTIMVEGKASCSVG